MPQILVSNESNEACTVAGWDSGALGENPRRSMIAAHTTLTVRPWVSDYMESDLILDINCQDSHLTLHMNAETAIALSRAGRGKIQIVIDPDFQISIFYNGR